MGWETGSQGPALLESAESPGTSHCLHLSFLILGWLTHEDSREGHSGFLVLRASSVSSSVDERIGLSLKDLSSPQIQLLFQKMKNYDTNSSHIIAVVISNCQLKDLAKVLTTLLFLL